MTPKHFDPSHSDEDPSLDEHERADAASHDSDAPAVTPGTAAGDNSSATGDGDDLAAQADSAQIDTAQTDTAAPESSGAGSASRADDGKIAAFDDDEALEALAPAPLEVDDANAQEHSTDRAAAPRTADGWDAWRAEAARVGGRSPLLRFIDTTATRIELSTTHPGGLATFITGRPTLLSSLIRDDLALRAARGAAAAIASKGVELASARNIDAVALGIGIASWPHEDGDITAPVLLRPLIIRRRGRDFELQLKGRPALNPRLAGILKREYGVTLDAAALESLADAEGTFSPNPVMDALRLAAAHVPGFSVQPRLVVSTFADLGEAMAADLAPKRHTVLDALAGSAAARERLEHSYREAPAVPHDRRAPDTDRTILDADAEQDQVIADIAAGNSIVVQALPGTGLTQTVVNAVGALVEANRRVLIVSPRRASLSDVRDRVATARVPGLAVQAGTLRRDLIAAISRNEKAERPDTADINDALVRLRKVLLDYRTALVRVDDELQVSVLDCLRELAKLSALDVPPQTTIRLSPESVAALVTERPRAAATVVKAGELGQFKYGPDDTPWYGASFASKDDAERAFGLARSLAGGELDEVLTMGEQVVGSTKIRPFTTIAELLDDVDLLAEVRETLDHLVSEVYDRPLDELIEATGTNRDTHLGFLERGRLRRHAKEYVRPGAHVPDLHDALVDARRQRRRWEAVAPAGSIPQVPVGLHVLAERAQALALDLAVLDEALGFEDDALSVNLSLEDLQERLDGLAAESDALHNIQERATLVGSLAELDIAPLLEDLAHRHVEGSAIEHEIELAWWQSALELLLQRQRALLGGNTAVLDRLEADYALVDEAHRDAAGAMLAWELAERWSLGIADYPDEADALRQALKAGRITPDALERHAPHLAKHVAPVWLASPYDVHAIGTATTFDTVILIDAGAVTIGEAAGALQRAPQVVAFGDSVTQSPSPFEVGISALGQRPSIELVAADEWHAESALERLSALLPTRALTRSYRSSGEDLVDIVNKQFYGGRVRSEPWAGSFLGHSAITVSAVSDSYGLPEQGGQFIESPDAEVQRVLNLITHHATTRPHESLMVVTANERHEVRVQQAVLAELGANQALTDFVVAEGEEPFVVADLEHAVSLSRDRVIFSVGYTRTPRGKHIDFGPFGEPGSERQLAVGMTRARKAMTIVSSFQATELDPDYCRHAAAILRDILLDAERRPRRAAGTSSSDPLLADLARRLEQRGLRTVVDHEGRIGLVVANGGMCAAIDLDDDAHAERSLRETLRLRPELLRRLGWHTMRVHAFELFTDPDAVVRRIAERVGVDAE